jgi:nicotinate-nucleotide pyrophosphorylase (carboxylating)
LKVPPNVAAQVAAALQEDIGREDVTAALIAADNRATGVLISREAAVLCGVAWVEAAFRQLDPNVELDWQVAEGQTVSAGQTLLQLAGNARALLTAERTALNFLQLLSATATQTARYVAAVAGTACKILDTRKTIPGLRLAQKYAVLCGGGTNHRLGLHDQILIKENHIAAAGSIIAAVARARELYPKITVEVETESLAELKEALAARADIIMLDEFAIEDMRQAVALKRAAGYTPALEVSGGVDLESIKAIAATGVDYISIGAITKHVRAIDLSLRLTTKL